MKVTMSPAIVRMKRAPNPTYIMLPAGPEAIALPVESDPEATVFTTSIASMYLKVRN